MRDSELKEKSGDARGRTIKERQMRLPNPGQAAEQIVILVDCSEAEHKAVT